MVGDVIIIDLDEFLEDAGVLEQVITIENSVNKFEEELSALNSLKVKHDDKVLNTANEILKLKEKLLEKEDDAKLEKLLKKLEIEISELKQNKEDVENQIVEKEKEINRINQKKEEIIKKSLIKLHEDLKRDYKEADKDKAKYMEMYREMKDKMSVLDKKIMYLKLIVSKNYDLRLL
ncbi:MAG: hypothetical protein Kow0019_02820 [Methanobacteriaceae archaeon]